MVVLVLLVGVVMVVVLVARPVRVWVKGEEAWRGGRGPGTVGEGRGGRGSPSQYMPRGIKKQGAAVRASFRCTWE